MTEVEYRPMRGRPGWEVSPSTKQWMYRERWLVMSWGGRKLRWTVIDLLPVRSEFVAQGLKTRAEAMQEAERIAGEAGE